MVFFAYSILPSIQKGGDPTFILALARSIFNDDVKLIVNDGDAEILAGLVTKSLSFAISKASYYPKNESILYSSGNEVPAYGSYGNPKLAQTHIEACLETHNEKMAKTVIDKLVDMTGVGPEIAHQRAFRLLLPSIPILSDVFNRHTLVSKLEIGLGNLCTTATSLCLDSVAKGDPSTGQLAKILKAMALSGDPNLFDT